MLLFDVNLQEILQLSLAQQPHQNLAIIKRPNDKATIPTKSNDLPQRTPTEYLTTQFYR